AGLTVHGSYATIISPSQIGVSSTVGADLGFADAEGAQTIGFGGLRHPGTSEVPGFSQRASRVNGIVTNLSASAGFDIGIASADVDVDGAYWLDLATPGLGGGFKAGFDAEIDLYIVSADLSTS